MSSTEKDTGHAGRTLRLPAPDGRVSQIHMRAVARLIDQWEADDENDNYSKGEAATDLRNAIAAICTCRALPHDRRCPSSRHTRVNPPGLTEDGQP